MTQSLKLARSAAIAAVLASLAGTSAFGQTRSQVWGGPIIQETQTASVTADVGMTTYDSKAANSKETQSTSTYTIAAWAGEGRELGASVQASDARVPFSLNDSSMKTSFRDVKLMARFLWMIPYVSVSLSEIDVARSGTEEVSLYGTGAGAGMAVAVPLHSMLVLQVEGGTTKSQNVYDKLGKDTKLGRRDDADAHLTFDVTDRVVDLLVGYRVRKYDIETTETTFHEQSQGAYAGLRLGLYF